MLTEKQREAVSMYCDCDCSLGEIADELGITRQG
ncbi:MAG: DNA-binding protein, partial [Firmicutes bacterium]|nr:DNA-binding protein [Bacillota bacterium]